MMNRDTTTYPHDSAGTSIASDEFYFPGLTKREHFAAAAMQGLLANPEVGTNNSATIAREAVRQADDLIEALNEGLGDQDAQTLPVGSKTEFVPDDNLAF